MASTTTTRARFGAVAVALAPAVMLVALVGHPFLGRLPDAAAVAEAVEQSTTRWGLVHLLTAVGISLTALAFLAIRAWLRDAGEDHFSAWAVPWVILGSALYGLLPGLEFAPMAAAEIGGDVAGVQAALEPWFIAILATGAIIFAVGILGFARGIAASKVLGRPLTPIIVVALVVLAASRFVPLGAVQFYVQAAAGLIALWPLAYRMWTSERFDGRAERRPGMGAGQGQSRPASPAGSRP